MRTRLALLAAVLFCFAAAAHAAEPRYPTKPIRIIIPTAPGGGSDVMVRMLGNKYTEAWGLQVVVDHRAGAGMTIGINLTAQATPDGHTMAVVNPSHAIIVPSKTPAPIVAKIHGETARALKSSDIVETLAKGASEPLGNTPREATEFVKVEIARWGKVIKQAKVKIE